MSDAPKQIWCGPDADGTWDYVWAELEPDPDLGRTVEYVLASELEALRKENERLRQALTRERLENLWNAYNTGHERDGKWTHAFMSDGEWLVREIGMDPTLGWYDASEIKGRIPEAAARAALQGETE